MMSLRDSLAGPGYVILNTIRVMNIIAFLDIIAACAVMLARISIENAFFFFEAASHVVIAGVSIFLIFSELPILTHYFERNWPLFGQRSGFITLAVVMIMLGFGVLGDLNKPSASQESLGLAFWRIVVSAGILALVMSGINVVSNFVFADRSTGVSARHVRTYGAAAPQKVVSRSSSYRSFQLGREDALPTYTTHAPSIQRPAKSMTIRSGTRFPLRISSPIETRHDAVSPKHSRDEEVAAPNLAHHPAMYSTHV